MSNEGSLFLLLLIILIILKNILDVKNSLRRKKEKEEKENENPKLPDVLPYKRKMLLTKTEYTFFKILKPICDAADYMICPKVRLEDLADVTDRQNILKWRGYIKSRHIDFLLTDNRLNVLAAIELDDSSHNSDKAQKTDEFKNNFFVKIGIPLFRIRTGQDYDEAIGNIIKGLKAQAEGYDS